MSYKQDIAFDINTIQTMNLESVTKQEETLYTNYTDRSQNIIKPPSV